jgi:Tfp pilus assembly protein PilN
MLRTNFSTRPFYNERVAQIALWALAVLVAAFTAFNVVQWRALSARHGQLMARVGDDERKASALRTKADVERRSVDRAELERLAASVREANELIGQRVFSWTGLLNTLEATVPPNVRIQSIRPAADRNGNLTVTMVAVGRRAEDIEQLVDQLEATKSFRHLYSRSETTDQQGLLEVALEGQYVPGVAPVKVSATAATAAPAAPARPAAAARGRGAAVARPPVARAGRKD